MRARPMAAIDAQFYWMSVKIPSDQFLLYAFAGVPADLDEAIAELLDRARTIPDLNIRVADAGALRYPRWVPITEPIGAVRHRAPGDSWPGCLDAVAGLTDDQLDVRTAPWRLHVFAPVHDIPGHRGAGTVAVLQVAHALADGGRASALAAWLFGRDAPVGAVQAPSRECLPWRAVVAARSPPQPGGRHGGGSVAASGRRPPAVGHQQPAGRRPDSANPGAAAQRTARADRHRGGAVGGVGSAGGIPRRALR